MLLVSWTLPPNCSIRLMKMLGSDTTTKCPVLIPATEHAPAGRCREPLLLPCVEWTQQETSRRTLTGDWLLRPFVGLGVGGRTYDFEAANVKTRSFLVGYGALGTEFQISRFAVRLEGRDYLSRMKDIAGLTKAATRNDLMVTAGLAYHLW